jgi:hypothetical protein
METYESFMKGKYTFDILENLCNNRGLEYRGEIRIHTRREKVKVYCGCSGEREVLVLGLRCGNMCCPKKAKLGENNPAYKKSPWNKGKKCPGLGGRPEGKKNSKPYSQEILEKYSQARKRITENGQPWSGFQRPQDENRPDKLYFIKLHNGKYKVGRSYKGWLYRKKETAELLGEWSGKSIDIWNLEKKVLKQFSQYKAPLNEMSMGRGMTEHFIDTLPVQEVVSFIDKCSQSSSSSNSSESSYS